MKRHEVMLYITLVDFGNYLSFITYSIYNVAQNTIVYGYIYFIGYYELT